MDAHAAVLTPPPTPTPTAAGPVLGTLQQLVDCVEWITDHAWLLLLVLVTAAVAGEHVVRRLATRASQERMALDLAPARHFDPSAEEILRRGIELTRASTSMPWWVPRRAKAVRIRLRADGASPLLYRVEGPAGAERLLSTTPFGPHVKVTKAAPLADKQRKHEVRAEFILRGNPVATLRDVPLDPDPLQPLVDAVADLRAHLRDLAELCIDLQRAPKMVLKARRWQLLDAARRSERGEATRLTRWMHRDHQRLEDSWLFQFSQILTPDGRRSREGGRMVMTPPPVRVDTAKAFGKLAEDSHLVRVQILVRCASDTTGRAEAHLARIQAAMDVFGGSARFAIRGWQIGPWRLGADRFPHRKRFDRRWSTGQCQPPSANWVQLTELLGLLKPPTVHCRIPLLPADLPSFAFNDPSLLLQGWYQSPDGRRRLVATHAAETLFEVAVGKAGGGKTERALAQAIALAHAGSGLLFVDPHRDSWKRGAPYLAHDHIMSRIARIDLKATGPDSLISSWNLIGMHHGRARHEVVEDTVDAFASAFAWDDTNAPRAIAIFTQALTILTAINELACRAQRPHDQATIFHVRALLTDTDFRTRALGALHDHLDEESRAWWQTVFPTLPTDSFNILLNPLTRLAANPVTRAFLGQGHGVYNIRAAMDAQMIVWVCTDGNGPTDKLLIALLARDLLRAGRSRTDLPEHQRVAFRVYLDELITLTGTAAESIAAMFEDLRKFRVHIHGMTQILARLPLSVRQSLLQNASTLSTTTGSRAAVSAITEEWGDRPSPAHVANLDRYDHYAQFTVDGRRIGPVLLHGPLLDVVFEDLRESGNVPALEAAADRTAGALPLSELTDRAAAQQQRVQTFLLEHAPAAPVPLTKSNKEYR
ncbi:ATP/GTP-binding protein [Streptomyces sp. NBC_01431]|uniref:ATP/GTP-binding protein n=1 Tax=Streptomyces sp. NBC_01431 TaxID=2903863 RepID=UPI002E377AF1|nr:ATP/GTP-binding protein [Streptomyces sp. NBC_01431]